MMAKKTLKLGLVIVPAFILLGLVNMLVTTSARSAAPTVRYVALSGSDSSNDCTLPASPCATIQHGVDVADPGDELHVAGGTYAPGGTVANIGKAIRIIGAYDPAFTQPDPDIYQTVLDASFGGPVVNIQNADDVFLQHLQLVHGDGSGGCLSSTVGGCGGGVRASGTDVHIMQCVIHDNLGSTDKGGMGGGVYGSATGHIFEIMESQIFSNTAASQSISPTQYGYGGGIYIEGGTAAINLSDIRDNIGSANHGGSGGIHLSTVSSAEVMSNTIAGNRSNDNANWWSGGGGLMIGYNASNVLVSGNLIEHNWGAAGGGLGGGIYIWGSDAELRRNVIRNNISGPSSGDGGGVYILSDRLVKLSNNLIAYNTSPGSGGGVFASHGAAPGAQVEMVNNTLLANGSTGVVADRNATITMTNNIIAFHTGPGVSESAPANIHFTADYNLLWNNSDPVTGSHAIQADPLLYADGTLRAGSPAKDQGMTIPWLTVDLEGNPREPGVYDIGAFEGTWWELYLPTLAR